MDKKYKVIKGSPDLREMRCTDPKCRNIARQVPDGKGGSVCQCSICGLRFSFSQI
jgi:hypothetical protein